MRMMHLMPRPPRHLLLKLSLEWFRFLVLAVCLVYLLLLLMVSDAAVFSFICVEASVFPHVNHGSTRTWLCSTTSTLLSIVKVSTHSALLNFNGFASVILFFVILCVHKCFIRALLYSSSFENNSVITGIYNYM